MSEELEPLSPLPNAIQDYLLKDSPRFEALRTVISRSRIDCGLPQLLETEELATIASWGALLEPVPTRFLDRAYTLAMRDYSIANQFGPFKAGLILNAYRHLSQTGALAKDYDLEQQKLLDQQCPHGCDRGWISIERERGEGLPPVSGVKPCPLHRR